MSVTESLKTVTTLVSAGSHLGPDSSWTKTAVTKLKNSSINERDELKRLNIQFKNYLDDVKRLEELNLRLIEEVERAKSSSLPRLVDKSQLDQELERTRIGLEDVSNESVSYQVRIDEAESLKRYINERLKFFQKEGDIQKQKIFLLQNQLNDILSQREYLLHGAKLANEDIERERTKQLQSENELENLRKSLSENRSRNKKIEFEMQTILDEIEFRKAIFIEESNYLRGKFSGTILSGADLTSFYKNELITAVRQIRQDFQTLNQQQISEYKELKEQELAYTLKAVEQERILAEQARSRQDASKDFELQNSKELRSSADTNKSELSQLNIQHGELNQRLNYLESALAEIKEKNSYKLDKLKSEIETLREQNQSYFAELEYWERVTRTKLESEIQTYRSILNSQLKLLHGTSSASLTFTGVTSTSNNSSGGRAEPQKQPPTTSNIIVENTSNGGGRPTPPISRPAPVITATTTRVITVNKAAPTAPQDAVQILRQVFDHFDTDRSGKINSSELDRVLSRLNIKLTQESYNQILREADYDTSRDLDFKEFCKIMMPVFTGKFDDDELWFAFKKFDLDNSGYITVSELKQILSKIGQHFSDDQIARMIATVDSDFDGRLNFKEFSRLMKSNNLVTTSTSTTYTVTTNRQIDTNLRAQPALTQSQAESIQILRQVFDYFDNDKSGKINSSELDRVLSRLNINLSKEAYNQILKEGDADLSRDIDFKEFCKIMLPVFTGKFEDDELWYAFKKFDLDNSGYITVPELKQILAKIGQYYTDEQISRMVATVDADFDGRLSFNEFSRLMKSSTFK